MVDEKRNLKDPQGLLTPKESKRKRGRPKKNNRTIDIGVDIGELKSWVCRKCLRRRSLGDFYLATDKLLDSSGHMSVCKYCLEDLYEKIYASEKSLDRTILKLCRIMNVIYDSVALETTRKTLLTYESRGKPISNVFGIYRKGLIGGGYERFGSRNDSDLTFSEPIKYNAPDLDPDEYDENLVGELENFWGKGLTEDEYIFLESEMDRYKKTHKCDTAAEESLLRQICFCELEIRKARERDGSPSSGIDMLQKLMKTASVDPAKTAIAGAGKSQDTFSAFIKTIEENEPADYYQDKELFKDFDNIDWYFQKYVVRPLKNFLTLSRDFNVEKDDGGDEEDFDIRDANEEQ